jgi:alpha-ketoglutarate-dependent taurine dioxygenase
MTDLSLPEPGFVDRMIEAPCAWTRDQVTEGRWRVPIPVAALDEIAAVIELLRVNPLDPRLLSPHDYALDACRKLMQHAEALLTTDLGLVVLDRLPVERYSKQELTAAYWLLSSMIARPVAQAYDGRVLYDVLDTGKITDTRVRSDITGAELYWHSDYGFNFPPPYIGLLVLRTAKEGGDSSAASMLTAHNVLQRRAPHLLRRLYQPFHWNRQGEHPDGDRETHFYPVFEYDGKSVRGRINKRLVYRGYELAGEPIDALGREALDAMFDVMSEPEHHFSFRLVPGQLQYMNNFRIAHRRTQYFDHDDPDRKRHLVRIFLRDGGRRSYMG